MKQYRGPLWTIDELGTKVAEALAVGYEGPPNGRVRDVPDRRTIRYYTTLGLIDRPAEMRGRTALYSRKHLMQLVMIKRLQSSGKTLAEVQRDLMGLTEAALERLTRLPAPPDNVGAITTEHAAADEAGNRASEAFWKETPSSVAAPPPKTRDHEPGPAPGDGEGPESLPPFGAALLQGVRLDDDTTLLLASPRTLHDDDLEAIRLAAQPLLRLLSKRRLLHARRERGKG